MIESIIAYLEMFVDIMDKGGRSMWVLFVLNLTLWYGLGYRSLILRRGTVNDVRLLVSEHAKEGGGKKCRGILDHAIVDALKAAAAAKIIQKKPRKFIRDALWPYLKNTRKYSVLVRTIVPLATLIGLLGTVVGMIETFDALRTSAMFSQGESISGGISKALFTTELGLIVAVPGLIIGKILDRKEKSFSLEFDQITDIISIKETTGEI
jgi:biopolymer transport protein ExbB